MNEEIIKELESQREKIEAIYVSVEKTRRYFKITLWVTIATVVLPMIGLVFAIPMFLRTYATIANI